MTFDDKVTAVESILTDIDQRVVDYSSHEDCGSGYGYILQDSQERIAEIVEKHLIEEALDRGTLDPYQQENQERWLSAILQRAYLEYEKLGGVETLLDSIGYGGSNYEDFIDGFAETFTIKKIADEVADSICDGSISYEAEHSTADYACYSGKGLCVWGFSIGEVEEQIELDSYPLLRLLCDNGELAKVLEACNSNAYTPSDRGQYKPGTDCIETYHNVGGQWHYVIASEELEAGIFDAVEQLSGLE